MTKAVHFLPPLLHSSLTPPDGPFSTGRGGTGNISAKGSPIIKAADKDVIPPQAQRIEKLQSHHVGRGGAGNEMHVHEHKGKHHEHEEGLADKLKHKLTGHKHE